MSASAIAQNTIALPVRTWHGSITPEQTKDLISAAKLGDQKAFAALYREYLPMVHRYVSSKVTGAAKAEDLVAEVFVRALKYIARYEFRGIEFSAWLVRIARNLILDQAKSGYATLEVLHDETPEPRGSDLADMALERIDAEILRNTLSKMIPDHRQVLQLRFVQGHSVAETSKIMHKTDGAIRVLQFRALRAMKRELERTAPDLVTSWA